MMTRNIHRYVPSNHQLALLLCCFFSLSLCLSNDDDIDWCSSKCEKRSSTMCEFDHQTFTDLCGDIKHEMTPQMRKHILHLHNEYRNGMAEGKNRSWPQASNMRQLGWDILLEVVAMRWADQCLSENDVCPMTPDFWYVGQNTAAFSNSEGPPDHNGTHSFEVWTSEIGNITVDPSTLVGNFSGSYNFGHFTQIIWAETYKIGCAQISFKKRIWFTTYLFCNYGLGGNFLNAQIYQAGPPCSKCPGGTNCRKKSDYPNLCALPDDPMKRSDIEGPSQELIESTAYVAPSASSTASPTALAFILYVKILPNKP